MENKNLSEFNALSDREKWDVFWKELKDDETLSWHCKHCDAKDDNQPWRCSPFPGNSIHCPECDGELTSRTGGGQNDPFNWILKIKRILFTEQNLIDLLSGKVVKIDDVQIALQDIGYDRIAKIIREL